MRACLASVARVLRSLPHQLARSRAARHVASAEPRRDALERSLCTRLVQCSYDELRVLNGILRRLELGRARYGFLDLRKDRRDFRRERNEEIADWVVYDACAEISDRDALGQPRSTR